MYIDTQKHTEQKTNTQREQTRRSVSHLEDLIDEADVSDRVSLFGQDLLEVLHLRKHTGMHAHIHTQKHVLAVSPTKISHRSYVFDRNKSK